jgi:hypothetical protein
VQPPLPPAPPSPRRALSGVSGLPPRFFLPDELPDRFVDLSPGLRLDARDKLTHLLLDIFGDRRWTPQPRFHTISPGDVPGSTIAFENPAPDPPTRQDPLPLNPNGKT